MLLETFIEEQESQIQGLPPTGYFSKASLFLGHMCLTNLSKRCYTVRTLDELDTNDEYSYEFVTNIQSTSCSLNQEILDVPCPQSIDLSIKFRVRCQGYRAAPMRNTPSQNVLIGLVENPLHPFRNLISDYQEIVC